MDEEKVNELVNESDISKELAIKALEIIKEDKERAFEKYKIAAICLTVFGCILALCIFLCEPNTVQQNNTQTNTQSTERGWKR